MEKFVISEALYEEIRLQPESKLQSAALYSRDRWLNDPEDGSVLLSYLVIKDVLTERGIELPDFEDKEALNRAINVFLSRMDGMSI